MTLFIPPLVHFSPVFLIRNLFTKSFIFCHLFHSWCSYYVEWLHFMHISTFSGPVWNAHFHIHLHLLYIFLFVSHICFPFCINAHIHANLKIISIYFFMSCFSVLHMIETCFFCFICSAKHRYLVDGWMLHMTVMDMNFLNIKLTI